MKLSSILLGAVLGAAAITVSADDLKIASGEKIAFLGDSITQLGNSETHGYLHLVILGLKTQGIDAVAIPAGISGHKSNDMLARVDRDVINKKPAWMLLSCGVNDVWHGKGGVPLDKYKENITKICDKADKAGIKVMILTATMIYEDPVNGLNKQLAAYNEFLRQLAAEHHYALADLNADMQALVAKKTVKSNTLTVDGVHMAIPGNKMMARGILKAFGTPDSKMAEIENVWDNTPGLVMLEFSDHIRIDRTAQFYSTAKIPLTIKEYNELVKKAKEEKKSITDYIHAHRADFRLKE